MIGKRIKAIFIFIVSVFGASILGVVIPVVWPNWFSDLTSCWHQICLFSKEVVELFAANFWIYATIILFIVLCIISGLLLFSKFSNSPDFRWYRKVIGDDDGKESAFLIWFPVNRKYTSPTLVNSSDFNVESVVNSVVIQELIKHKFIELTGNVAYSITINKKAYSYYEKFAKKHIINKNVVWHRQLIKTDFRNLLKATIEPRVDITIYRKKKD